jgi:hypothetical protein
MPKKGEKLSPEHLAKMKAGRERMKAMKGSGTNPIESQVPNVTNKKIANVVDNSLAAPVPTRSGVQASGETKIQEVSDAVRNDYTGPSAAISNQLPGQKAEIEKQLSLKVKKVSNPKPAKRSKTVEGQKTDDPKAIDARAPFSFAALRMKLLA